MFSLPASMKKIRSKMKALECSQHFPHYNPMRAIRCHGHQSSDPFPHPNDGSDKISLQLAHWLQRYLIFEFKIVDDDDGRTDGRTDGRRSMSVHIIRAKIKKKLKPKTQSK